MLAHFTATSAQKQRSNRMGALWRLMRADKPVGIWLLWLPCCWALALAKPRDIAEHLEFLLLFLIGAFAMRSAGCVINDLTDQKIDCQVARTRNRPLASGELCRYDALCLLAFLLCVSLWVSVQMHPNVLYWSIAALAPVIAYPWMKRITYWPQAFLGITFNLGTVFGAVAVHGTPNIASVWLYAAGICWTIAYDTIYAHQDIEDDLRIGVKSTAIRFGHHSRAIIAAFYLLSGASLALAAHAAHTDGPMHYFPAFIMALGGIWLARTTDFSSSASCLRGFKQNVGLGAFIWLGLLIFQ